jgi:hypothetical protein
MVVFDRHIRCHSPKKPYHVVPALLELRSPPSYYVCPQGSQAEGQQAKRG